MQEIPLVALQKGMAEFPVEDLVVRAEVEMGMVLLDVLQPVVEQAAEEEGAAL